MWRLHSKHCAALHHGEAAQCIVLICIIAQRAPAARPRSPVVAMESLGLIGQTVVMQRQRRAALAALAALAAQHLACCGIRVLMPNCVSRGAKQGRPRSLAHVAAGTTLPVVAHVRTSVVRRCSGQCNKCSATPTPHQLHQQRYPTPDHHTKPHPAVVHACRALPALPGMCRLAPQSLLFPTCSASCSAAVRNKSCPMCSASSGTWPWYMVHGTWYMAILST